MGKKYYSCTTGLYNYSLNYDACFLVTKSAFVNDKETLIYMDNQNRNHNANPQAYKGKDYFTWEQFFRENDPVSRG